MPSYSSNAFTLEEAHAAAATAVFKPARLSNLGRFSFNSRACHVGGDKPQALLGYRARRAGVLPLPRSQRARRQPIEVEPVIYKQ